MKFNLEFDFSDLEFDEGNITELLKHSIQNNLIHELKKQIDERVFNSISSAVRATIETKMDEIIAEKIKSVIESGEIKHPYLSQPTNVNDYINSVFERTDLNKRMNEYIEKSCKSFVEELKKQYDLAFASHIVKNMQQNNLLKDNVADLLLSGK